MGPVGASSGLIVADAAKMLAEPGDRHHEGDGVVRQAMNEHERRPRSPREIAAAVAPRVEAGANRFLLETLQHLLQTQGRAANSLGSIPIAFSMRQSVGEMGGQFAIGQRRFRVAEHAAEPGIDSLGQGTNVPAKDAIVCGERCHDITSNIGCRCRVFVGILWETRRLALVVPSLRWDHFE